MSEWSLFKDSRSPIWKAQRIDEAGKRHRLTTGHSAKADAQRVVAQWNARLADPVGYAKANYTLADAVAAMRTNREVAGKAAGTLMMYDYRTRPLLAEFGGRPLSTITPGEVEAYVAKRLKTAARPTVDKELKALRLSLKIAKRSGLYAGDPGMVMPLDWSSGYVPRETFLTLEQTMKLLDELSMFHDSVVSFAIASGMRKSEIWRVKREHVDLERKVLFVDGRKTEDAKAYIPITPIAMPFMLRALASRPRAGLLYPKEWTNPERDINLHAARLGIPWVTLNDLRRTCASWHLQQGVSAYVVSKILRHADTRMVERVYGKVKMEHLHDLINKDLGITPRGDQINGVRQNRATEGETPRDLGAQRAVSAEVDTSENPEKTARPARFERATFGFGGLSRSENTRRKTPDTAKSRQRLENDIKRAVRRGVKAALAQDKQRTLSELATAARLMGATWAG